MRTIATAPSQYAELISALNKDGCTPYSLRKKFAAAAFAHSARQTLTIASWFAGQLARRTGRGTHSIDTFV